MNSVFRVSVMLVAVLGFATALSGQTNAAKAKPPTALVNAAELQPIKASPAYAELLLHRTELESDLDSLLVDYTEEFPKVKSIRAELGFLKSEMDRLLAVRPTDTERLTLALGKLMLRKVELETGLDALRSQFSDDHPDVRKARKKIDTFEAAIKEILGK